MLRVGTGVGWTRLHISVTCLPKFHTGAACRLTVNIYRKLVQVDTESLSLLRIPIHAPILPAFTTSIGLVYFLYENSQYLYDLGNPVFSQTSHPCNVIARVERWDNGKTLRVRLRTHTCRYQFRPVREVIIWWFARALGPWTWCQLEAACGNTSFF